MAVSNFIQTLWSATILHYIRLQSVWGNTGSRDWQAEAANARTVKIQRINKNSVTVKDYAVDTDIADAQVINDLEYELVMDQQKYFNIYVDDINQKQSKPNLMGPFGQIAGEKVNGEVEQYVANKLVSKIPNANYIDLTNSDFSAVGVFDLGAGKSMAMEEELASGLVHMRTNDESAGLAPYAITGAHISTAVETYLAQSGQDQGFQGKAAAAIEGRLVKENGSMGRFRGFDFRYSKYEPKKPAGQGNLSTPWARIGTTSLTSGTNNGRSFYRSLEPGPSPIRSTPW